MSQLDQAAMNALLGQNPEAILASALGVAGGSGDTSAMAGANSANPARAGQATATFAPSASQQLIAQCGHTCTDSCDYTCGANSCGHTTGVFEAAGSLVNPAARMASIDPATGAQAAGFPSTNRQLIAQCGHTCTDSCDYTCGANSCGHTTGVFEAAGSLVNPAARMASINPAAGAQAAGFPSASQQLMAQCGHTCTDSCDYTCGGGSCGHTTGVFESMGNLVNPGARPPTPFDPAGGAM